MSSDDKPKSVIDQILDDIAQDIVDEIKKEIDFEDLKFTGQLQRSWEIEKTGQNERTIGSPLIWAAALDGGRVPGKMPPVDALFPWVKQKLGVVDDVEARSMAFAVAKKIEKEGIEPRHYVRRALLNLEGLSE